MSRLLCFSDTHLRASNPSCRKDSNFYETQMAKFKEVVELSKSLKVDAVINGGDLFDLFDPVHSLMHDVMKILNDKGNIPWYVNPGNHDQFAANPDTLDRSGLGILAQAGLIKIFKEPTDVWVAPDALVRFIPYRLDEHSAMYSFDKKDPMCAYIVSPHDLLSTHFVPYHHQLISELKTNSDFVLCSHWHAQFIEKHGNTVFANSGPLTRQTVNEAKLKPAVLLVETVGSIVNVTLVPIQHKPASEVIDETRTVVPEREGLAEQFLATLRTSALESLDRQQLLRTIGQQKGFDARIVEHGLGRLKEIEKSVGVI